MDHSNTDDFTYVSAMCYRNAVQQVRKQQPETREGFLLINTADAHTTYTRLFFCSPYLEHLRLFLGFLMYRCC